jgi:hypothetical protein
LIINDIDSPEDACQFLTDVLRDGTIAVSGDNSSTLQKFVAELDNPELSTLLLDYRLGSGPINCDNAVGRLRAKAECLLDFDEELHFVASRFYDVHHRDEIPVDLLEEILASPHLKVETENSLMEFLDGFEHDGRRDGLSLLHHVHCEYLTGTALSTYLDAIFPDSINAEIWGSVCRRLHQTPLCDAACDRFRVWEFNRERSEGGILAYLGRHNYRIAPKFGSSHPRLDPYDFFGDRRRGLVEFRDANGEGKHSVSFDFKGPCVSVNGFLIDLDLLRGPHDSWVIEISNDENEWTVVHSERAEERIGDALRTYFRCEPTEFCRHIRLTQTGGSFGFDERTNFGLQGHTSGRAALEFFGQWRCLPTQ